MSRGRRVEVFCPDCGESRLARSDAAKRQSGRCRSCANRAAWRKRTPRPRKGTWIDCEICEEPLYRIPSDSTTRFCSPACAGAAKRKHAKEQRTCRTCGQVFAYTLRPFSNSSGTYCSFACRNAGYVGHYRGKPTPGHRYRHGWKRTRRLFMGRGNDFCLLCLAKDDLAVHHLKPYRVDRDDSDLNLITVCHPCHLRLDRLSNALTERLGPRELSLFAVVGTSLLEDRRLAHAGRRLETGRYGRTNPEDTRTHEEACHAWCQTWLDD